MTSVGRPAVESPSHLTPAEVASPGALSGRAVRVAAVESVLSFESEAFVSPAARDGGLVGAPESNADADAPENALGLACS